MCIKIHIKKKPPRQLISEAIRHYNFTSDHTNIGGYWIDEATADTAFLLRIIYNYVRHELTFFSGIVPDKTTKYDDSLNYLRNSNEYSYGLYNRIKRAVNNRIERQYAEIELVLCGKCTNDTQRDRNSSLISTHN
jgi:hypothetical protein